MVSILNNTKIKVKLLKRIHNLQDALYRSSAGDAGLGCRLCPDYGGKERGADARVL